MAFVDPFTPDAFKLQTLTAAINNIPYFPMQIGSMGIFEEQGVPTTSVAIEEKSDGALQLLTATPRGAPGKIANTESRKIHSFMIPHIITQTSVLADEVQGIRTFGSENQMEILQNRVNEKLAIMRRDIDYFTETARVKALQGYYVNVNNASVSLFTEFSVSPQSQDMNFSASATSSARANCFEVLEKMSNALGAVPYSGVHALCSSGFWKMLVEDKDAKETYLNTQMASSLRGDPRLMFEWNGIIFEWYRGTSTCKIPDNTAIAFPMGVPGLFISRYAPANYVETVNTVGVPYYAKSEPMEFGKGYNIEAQSNQIHICTRPASLISLTL